MADGSSSSGPVPRASGIEYADRMALSDDFEAAQARVKTLPRTPEADELLRLYALFKQATVGDVQGSRPGMLDFKGRAKHDAWAAVKGKDKDGAMRDYVELVSTLEAKYR